MDMDIVNNIRSGAKVVGPTGTEFVVRRLKKYDDDNNTFRLYSPRRDILLNHKYTEAELKKYGYKIIS